MLVAFLVASVLVSSCAGRDAPLGPLAGGSGWAPGQETGRLLQSPHTTTSEGCPARTFEELATRRCLPCHHSCSRCRVASGH